MLVGDSLKNNASLFLNKPAVIFGKRKLTYEKAWISANRLAGVLISCGISKDDQIGVLIDVPAESAIGIFLILKTDSTFVAIDFARSCKH
jgi:non-ribosomal peptide synthetase component E (peptide arylation enzyme)